MSKPTPASVAPDAPRITRHFATITHGRFGARQVHYRRAGSGPCVVLFHQSPLSSRDVVATMQRWSRHYTCIAPDTPGYGLSDPFGVPSVEMSDIADAAIEFLDAIGVQKCAVYGFHTGAMIAAAVGRHHPDRVSCATSNGYVVLTEAERRDFLEHYLTPFAPTWDGAHLAWLWARLRDQTIFFPWYRQVLATRMDWDTATPEKVQDALVEFLRADDQYRVGYRAAFSFRSDLALRETATPTLITAAEADPLHAMLPRILHPASCVEVRSGGTWEGAVDTAKAFIDRHLPPPAPPVAPTHALRGRVWNQMVDVPGGQVRVRRNTDAAGRTVVLLHDALGAADELDAVAKSLVGRRPVLALDLPGHGESDDVAATADVSVARDAAAVRDVLEALSLDTVDVHAAWGGGLVGLELAKQAPARVRRLALADVPWFDAETTRELQARYAPAIEIAAHGGHLLEAWYMLRDSALFWPWYDRTRKGIVWREPRLDPVHVQRRVTNLFKAPRRWRLAQLAHFAYPVQAELRAARVPVLLCAAEWSPHEPHTREAARATGLSYVELPPERERWGAAFLPFLDAS